MSGLAVNVLGVSTAIVISSAVWCEIHKDIILSVLEESLKDMKAQVLILLDATLPVGSDQMVTSYLLMKAVSMMRTRRKLQPGVFCTKPDKKEDVSPVATESSVKYLTYLYYDGQKTGYYRNQREN